MTKRKNNRRNDRRSEAWEEFLVQIAVWLTKGLLFVLVPLVALWFLLGGLDQPALRILATAAFYCLIPAFLAGEQYGQTHADSFTQGIETAIEKLSDAVDLRDSSLERNTSTRRRPPPVAAVNYNDYLPQQPALPQVRHKAIQDGEVIDL